MHGAEIDFTHKLLHIKVLKLLNTYANIPTTENIKPYHLGKMFEMYRGYGEQNMRELI